MGPKQKTGAGHMHACSLPEETSQGQDGPAVLTHSQC